MSVLESLRLRQKQQLPELNNKVLRLLFEPDKNHISEYGTLLNSFYGLQFTNDGLNNPIFTFGIVSERENTMLYIILQEEYENIFKKEFAAVDPFIQFEEIEDPLKNIYTDGFYTEGYDLHLLYNDHEKHLKSDKPQNRFMSSIINAMNNYDTNDYSVMEVSIQSACSLKTKKYKNIITKGLIKTVGFSIGLAVEGIRLFTGMNEDKKKIVAVSKENKKGEIKSENLLNFNTNIRVISRSENQKAALDNIKGMAAAFTDQSDSNSLIPFKIDRDKIVRDMKNSNKLSTQELIQFVHLPGKDVCCENLEASNCKKVYDRDVPTEGIKFGISNGNDVAFPMVPLSVKNYSKVYSQLHKIVDNFAKPRIFLGQQGTGKSEAIINFAIACIKMGIGIIVVDPKNDTQQRLIESIPDEFMHKLDYINFGDTIYPPGMNMFQKRGKEDDPTENSLIVTSFISLMKKEYKNWGFHIERILQHTAEAILLMEPATLHEFELMLVERKYREHVIATMNLMIKDPDKKGKSHIKKLIRYWESFNDRDDKIINKDIEPVMNQIGPFLSNRVIKAIVSQKESFNFRNAADQGRIVIINLPEGVLCDNTKLLASMINKSIWLDIQSRAALDISERFPVAWIIDEAHEIVDEEFVSVLTKARAYRLGLTLVTQGLSNFNIRKMESIKELIQTNCKNKIVFRVGYIDRREIGEEFSPLTPTDIQNCPDYHFYAKIILEDGKVSNPFFGSAPPMVPRIRIYDKYIAKHRSGRFTVDQIEDELEERMDHIDVLNKLLKCE